MARIIERYRERGSQITVYQCDGCGQTTKRYKAIPNRNVYCVKCQKLITRQKADEKKDEAYKAAYEAGYAKGYSDGITDSEYINRVATE